MLPFGVRAGRAHAATRDIEDEEKEGEVKEEKIPAKSWRVSQSVSTSSVSSRFAKPVPESRRCFSDETAPPTLPRPRTGPMDNLAAIVGVDCVA